MYKQQLNITSTQYKAITKTPKTRRRTAGVALKTNTSRGPLSGLNYEGHCALLLEFPMKPSAV